MPQGKILAIQEALIGVLVDKVINPAAEFHNDGKQNGKQKLTPNIDTSHEKWAENGINNNYVIYTKLTWCNIVTLLTYV